MKTLHLTVDPGQLEAPEAEAAIGRAAAILRAGGLVALPTETVYGLGANALDRAAVEKIFKAKQRPAWDPIIVHVSGEAMLEGLVEEVPEVARRLIKAFWPGPLTLLLPRKPAVPDAVTAGRPLVGVRMPSHPVALELIRRAGVPVAAPSANRFGHISPTTAAHVLHDLEGRIDAVLDAGPTPRGVESTVLDPSLKPDDDLPAGRGDGGADSRDRGPVETVPEVARSAREEALPSPGVALRHYAPRARLVLVEAPADELGARLAEAARACQGEPAGRDAAGRCCRAARNCGRARVCVGPVGAPEELAQRLYAGLRALDAAGCTRHSLSAAGADGLGAAIATG